MVEEKAAETRRTDQQSLMPSRRDKWFIIAAIAALMFIFDGLQVGRKHRCTLSQR